MHYVPHVAYKFIERLDVSTVYRARVVCTVNGSCVEGQQEWGQRIKFSGR